VDAGPACFYVLHDVRQLDLVPEASGFHAVISGHTHQAEQSERNGVLYLNPGSAGPKRFHLPVTLAILEVEAKPWQVQIVELV